MRKLAQLQEMRREGLGTELPRAAQATEVTLSCLRRRQRVFGRFFPPEAKLLILRTVVIIWVSAKQSILRATEQNSMYLPK